MPFNAVNHAVTLNTSNLLIYIHLPYLPYLPYYFSLRMKKIFTLEIFIFFTRMYEISHGKYGKYGISLNFNNLDDLNNTAIFTANTANPLHTDLISCVFQQHTHQTIRFGFYFLVVLQHQGLQTGLFYATRHNEHRILT